MKTIYQFENSWHKKYAYLVFVNFSFLLPLMILMCDEDIPYTHFLNRLVSIISIVGTLIFIFFTETEGEESILSQIKTDKKFRRNVILRMLFITAVLASFYYFVVIKQ